MEREFCLSSMPWAAGSTFLVSSRNRTIAVWPSLEAMVSGVSPVLVAASGSAPALYSSYKIDRCPLDAA